MMIRKGIMEKMNKQAVKVGPGKAKAETEVI